MGVKLCDESHFEHIAIAYEGGEMTPRFRSNWALQKSTQTKKQKTKQHNKHKNKHYWNFNDSLWGLEKAKIDFMRRFGATKIQNSTSLLAVVIEASRRRLSHEENNKTQQLDFMTRFVVSKNRKSTS